MEPWLLALLTSVTSILASGGFWAWLSHKSNTKSATTELLKGLAYDRIAQKGMEYIRQGWIFRDEYEDFHKLLYEPYKKLGGNGVAERIMRDVSQLPLKSPGKYIEKQ